MQIINSIGDNLSFIAPLQSYYSLSLDRHLCKMYNVKEVKDAR